MGRLRPGLHGLLEPWHQVHKLANAERNRVDRECLSNEVGVRWCFCVGYGRCDILAHPLDVRRVGLGHALLGCLSYFIFLLPFYRLCLVRRCDQLHFGRDNVHG